MKTLLPALLLATTIAYSQHNIPFASTNNIIDLSVANVSAVAASNVVVNVSAAPSWLKFENSEIHINDIKSKQSGTASFTFSVDKSAPVNMPHPPSSRAPEFPAERRRRSDRLGRLMLPDIPPRRRWRSNAGSRFCGASGHSRR